MNCVYIKLAPYLAQYWYSKRNIPKGQPLTLPDKEYMQFICSSLCRNEDLYRNPARNAKGVLKDTTCYCRNAYEFSVSKEQPPLLFSDKKIPSKEECKYLFPFLIPEKVCVEGKDRRTDGFYELKSGSAEPPLRGYSGIRKYIMIQFYADLNRHITEEALPYIREGKKFSARALITDFLDMHGIGDCNYSSIRVEAYNRTDISMLKAQVKGAGDLDSIHRTLNSRKFHGQVL